MPMPISPSDITVSPLKDEKDLFQRNRLETAFKKRYGKPVDIQVTYDLTKDKTIKEYTLHFNAEKNNQYFITEYLVDDITDKVFIKYIRGGEIVENVFNRFVDAEITLADLISEE
jgi:uncharacterized protein (DUF1697 family)